MNRRDFIKLLGALGATVVVKPELLRLIEPKPELPPLCEVAVSQDGGETWGQLKVRSISEVTPHFELPPGFAAKMGREARLRLEEYVADLMWPKGG